MQGADGGREPAVIKSSQKLQRKSLEHNKFILSYFSCMHLTFYSSIQYIPNSRKAGTLVGGKKRVGECREIQRFDRFSSVD